MPTIGNYAAATQAQASAVDTVVPAENGAANATVKVSILQLAIAAQRPSLLTAVATPAVTAAALFALQDPSLGVDPSRQVTLAQMVALMNARVGQVWDYQPTPKVGTTAGWVVGAANNLGKMATLPAAQAGSTLVIPIPALKPGWIITGAALNGSIQSAGNVGTILLDIRALTAAAAGATDASLSVMGAALSVTANTILSVANVVVPAFAETVLPGKSYFALVTSTTNAAVTQELQSLALTITEN